ncbi:hypothetical protein A3Q56_05737, partial [Intoshia linei]
MEESIGYMLKYLIVNFSEGAVLVKIIGEQQNEAIFQFAESQDTAVTNYWIGMNRVDLSDKTSFRWSNGDVINTLSVGFWSKNQPITDSTTNEDCVIIEKSNAMYIYPYAFKFISCELTNAFICEKKIICLIGYFPCNQGKCIKNEFKCDGVNDCDDGLDELNCQLINGVTQFYQQYTESPGQITFSQATESVRHIWHILTGINNRISLNMTTLTSSTGIDTLIIRSGSQSIVDGQIIAVYTGTLIGYEKNIYSIDNNIIMEYIKSPSSNDLTFSADYKWISDTSINQAKIQRITAQDSDQVIEYSNDGKTFYGDKEKIWIISVDTGSLITIKINTIYLIYGSSLSFYNGDYLKSKGTLLATYQEVQKIASTITVISTSNEITIIFTNDYNYESYFDAVYNKGCGYDMVMSYGQLSSPGYGIIVYPPFVMCKWTIKPESYPYAASLTLEMTLSAYQIFSDDNLIIRRIDADLTKSILFDSKTDMTPDTQIFDASNGYFEIEFTTNSINHGKGFKLDYAINCNPIVPNANTKMIPNTSRLGDKPVFSCDVGYSFEEFVYQGKITFTGECTEQGWSMCIIPTCTKKICGHPPVSTNVYLVSKTGITYESTAQYVCKTGTIIDTTETADLTATCTESGAWTPSPICKPSDCVPIVITNGIITISLGTNQEIDSISEISCDPGYFVSGDTIVQCKSTGWVPPLPTCEKITCFERQFLHTTTMNAEELIVTPLKYNDQREMSCLDGFSEQNQNTFVTCNADGTLTNFVCIDDDDCDPEPCDVNTSTCQDLTGGYKCNCNPGYKPTLIDSNVCEDIDECADPGTYDCSHS